jgi:hypothetical protein
MAWTPRPKGHIADPVGLYKAPLPDHVVGQGMALPESAQLSQYVGAIRDQGGAEACEGFGWARALDIRAKVQGLQTDYPSEYAIWTLGRGNGLQGPLTNSGAASAVVAAGLAEFGIVSEKRLPFPTDGDYTKTLPLDFFQHGVDALIRGVYGIEGSVAYRCLQIRQALAAGYPVPFAMDVDASYEQDPGSLYTGPTGPVLGGHEQVLVDYAPGKFRVCGSWGASWASGGYAWVSDSFVGGPHCFDFYAVDLAPSEVT